MAKNANRRKIRGQAMVEYSAITFIIAVGTMGALNVPIGVNGSLLKIFWDGLNGFYDSVYYVLQCSVP